MITAVQMAILGEKMRERNINSKMKIEIIITP